MEVIGSRRAAKLLGISREVLGKRVRAGDIEPFAKMEGETGAYLFDVKAIEQLAEKYRRQAAQAEEAS